MGTPQISEIYLNYLIDKKYNIVGVFTQPPRKKGRGMKFQKSSVHELAILNNLKVFTPLNLNNQEINQEILKLNPDLIIVMGYGLKLTTFILDFPKLGCINIHVSLLPRWRGAAPIEHALLNGDKTTGITIFKLIDEMDAGPIITSESINIYENENKYELTNRLNILGTKLLDKILPTILGKKIIYKNQDINKITYAKKISTEMRKLNFNQNIQNIQNQIRAFAPNPSAWFYLKNEKIKIIKSTYEKGNYKPSIILNRQFHIGCNDGKICPKIVQREGKRTMELEEFLRGFSFEVGNKVNA